jgi:hypothetical protein
LAGVGIPDDFIFQLRGQAEQVGVVLREAAHAEESVQSARSLVAVYRAQLGPAQGQVAVGLGAVLVEQAVEGAVHGLDLVLVALHLHGLEHVVAVEVEVARGLPQVQVRDVRSVQELVAGLYEEGIHHGHPKQ